MKKQQYDKVVSKMKEFIEPGEEVKEAFSARGSHPYTAWIMAIPPLMVFFNKPRIIVATDRNFYVMHGMSTPGQVLAKYPRATTSITTGEKRFFMLKVNVGPTTVWAPMVETAAARQFAASSTPGGSAGAPST